MAVSAHWIAYYPYATPDELNQLGLEAVTVGMSTTTKLLIAGGAVVAVLGVVGALFLRRR